jgi:hypothetical protein
VFHEEYNLENVFELLDYYARASGLNYTHRMGDFVGNGGIDL